MKNYRRNNNTFYTNTVRNMAEIEKSIIVILFNDSMQTVPYYFYHSKLKTIQLFKRIQIKYLTFRIRSVYKTFDESSSFKKNTRCVETNYN